MDFIYKQPVGIVFGVGRSERIDELARKYDKPFIVTDKFFEQNGFAYKLAEKLGVPVKENVFCGVSPNPDVSEVDSCSAALRAADADIIIAVGGGSAIDLAKAASVKEEHISLYHGTGVKVPEKHLPLIAVPTTSGTGSEVTNVSVLTDRITNKKAPIASDSFYPSLAVIDPKLTLSAPPNVTASTGIDVLCHAVEGYWSLGHQPVCDALAVHAVRTTLEYLPAAFENPGDINAREKMSEASVIAGLAFALPKTTSSHACSFPLTSLYNIPHGEACGLTLDHFMRINAADKRTQELAKLVGFSNADGFADEIAGLKVRLGLRTDLSDLKITDSQTEELVRLSRHPNMANNPIEITDEMLYELYNKLRGENYHE